MPLVRKLHALGCKTMLLAWDFEYADHLTGDPVTTRVSRDLWNIVSYPIEMCPAIDEGLKENDPVYTELFVMKDPLYGLRADEPIDPPGVTGSEPAPPEAAEGNGRHSSTVMSKFHNYGFIHYPENNLFFLNEDVEGASYSDLQIGDPVEFSVVVNSKGQRVAKHVRRAEAV